MTNKSIRILSLGIVGLALLLFGVTATKAAFDNRVTQNAAVSALDDTATGSATATESATATASATATSSATPVPTLSNEDQHESSMAKLHEMDDIVHWIQSQHPHQGVGHFLKTPVPPELNLDGSGNRGHNGSKGNGN